MTLHPKLVAAIQRIREDLQMSGAQIPANRLAGYYTLFREKFGPDRLAGLDGESLLTDDARDRRGGYRLVCPGRSIRPGTCAGRQS